jgi:hypothetical protein
VLEDFQFRLEFLLISYVNKYKSTYIKIKKPHPFG